MPKNKINLLPKERVNVADSAKEVGQSGLSQKPRSKSSDLPTRESLGKDVHPSDSAEGLSATPKKSFLGLSLALKAVIVLDVLLVALIVSILLSGGMPSNNSESEQNAVEYKEKIGVPSQVESEARTKAEGKK